MKKFKSKSKSNHYKLITDSILASMQEADLSGKWEMPWHRNKGRPVNGVTGRAYKGTNVLSLWASGRGKSNEWATYRQWTNDAGGVIKKGSRGTPVVFYLPAKPTDPDTKDDDNSKGRMVLKFSHVFNRDDVEGLEPVKLDVDPDKFEKPESLAHVEDFVSNTGAVIEVGGSKACYQLGTDKILMPDPSLFYVGSPTEAWYSTLLHELAHWTGSENRLSRFSIDDGVRFGSDAYAFEELIAEVSCSLLAADLGIETEPREDHAQYIAGWIKQLSEDETAFPRACALAEKAVTYLHELQKSKIVGKTEVLAVA